MNRMFGLVDCNNFFVSCERLFRPDLTGVPVIVMSSNDGCVIARSNEVKQLGVPMGAPIFKYKEIIKEHNIVLFSANFRLYGDISRRLSELLATQAPKLEIYSIDESFLDLATLPIKDYELWANKLIAKISQEIGLPVSVGIGPTKTLAKLASELAKKDVATNTSILSAGDPLLSHIAVEDIWGVGRKYAPKLRLHGIATAQDIANTDASIIRKIFSSIQGARMQMELNGNICLEIESSSKPQHAISASRTFGNDIHELHELEAAVASLAAKAAYSLRRNNQLAHKIIILTSTSRFKTEYKKHIKSSRLRQASCHTGQIIETANSLVRELFQHNIEYHRAGIVLTDLVSERTASQQSFFDQTDIDNQKLKNLSMLDIDELNKKYGRNTVHYASEDLSKKWQPKQTFISPNYTTEWQNLPKIY